MTAPPSIDSCPALLVDGGHDAASIVGKKVCDAGCQLDRCATPSDGVNAYDDHQLVVLMVKDEASAQSARHYVSWLRHNCDTGSEPVVMTVGPQKVIAQFGRLRCELVDQSTIAEKLSSQVDDALRRISENKSRSGGSLWSKLFTKSSAPSSPTPAATKHKVVEPKPIEPRKPVAAKPTVAPAKSALATKKPQSALRCDAGQEKSDDAPATKNVVKPAGSSSQSTKADTPKPSVDQAKPKSVKPETKPTVVASAPTVKPKQKGSRVAEDASAAAYQSEAGKKSKRKVDPFLEALAKSDTMTSQLVNVAKPAEKSVAAKVSEGRPVSVEKPIVDRSVQPAAKPSISPPSGSRPSSVAEPLKLRELEVKLDSATAARKRADDRADSLASQLEKKNQELMALVESLSSVAGAATPMSPPPKAGGTTSDAGVRQKPRCANMWGDMVRDVVAAEVNDRGDVDMTRLVASQVKRNLESLPGSAGDQMVVDLPDDEQWVPVRYALPLVTSICECFCNAFEHGMKLGEKKGVVRAQFTTLGDELVVEVCDTGAGLPLEFDLGKIKTGGLARAQQMVSGLGGSIVVNAATETRCQINVPRLVGTTDGAA